MTRTKEGQEKHDRGVLNVGNEAVNRGWLTVFVDLPGYQKPPMISGFIPDVYAHNGYRELVVEVETSDTINSQHTTQQCAAFRQWANEYADKRNFVVVEV